MKISALIPCYNEEKNVEASVLSCLNQTKKFNQIIFVNDSSTDRTPEILAKYADQITVVKTPKNTGNKSSAQEYGLQFVTGNIMITTDADTVLDKNFVSEITKSFKNRKVVAVAGSVQSIAYNWLTLCRAYDYTIGQRIHKTAQNYINYIFVMPGAASAFRTLAFKRYVTFDHDTITEDLDFTYKLHDRHLKIIYNPRAISYTQDPADLKNYINQMRRWFGGGWQNLLKHYGVVPSNPIQAFELALSYSEGLIFSVLVFLIPILNPWIGLWLLFYYFLIELIFATWAAIKERRPKIILVPFPYLILIFINAYIYLEQFVIEIILKRKNLIWFKPERIDL